MANEHPLILNRTVRPSSPRARPRRTSRVLPIMALLAGMSAMQPVGLPAQAEHLGQLSSRFEAQLQEIATRGPGVVGISVIDLTSGERFGANQDLVFPQGSSIKVSVLVEMYRQAHAGSLQLDERLPVRSSDMAGGAGILQRFGDGTAELSLRDLAVLMIVLSDNTATNLLIQRVGMDATNRTMAELGFPNTRVQRLMIRPGDSAAGRENISTPAEAAELMARLARCDLPVSEEQCEDMLAILRIPKANPSPGSLPAGVPVAWKGGSITGVKAGWGVVRLAGRPYAIAAMVNYGDASAMAPIEEAAAAAYDYFSRLAGATPHGARVPLRYLDEGE